MLPNQKLQEYNYYGKPQGYPTDTFVQKYPPPHHHHHHRPCPPDEGLAAYPAPPWDKSVAEHNLDKNAHPYLLSLFRNGNSLYFCKDSIADRDAIEEGLRVEGVMAYVVETDLVYRLEGGIENTDWKELNINSNRTMKLGRYNPPANPEDGLVYFDLNEGRLKLYIGTAWETMPNYSDILRAINIHDADPNAHADLFADAENKWLAI